MFLQNLYAEIIRHKKTKTFVNCCVKFFCICSIHQHIVIWVDGAGPQCSFHFLLITQRKPMTSLARGAESGFLISQNDFFFHEVSPENYVVKSRWAHNRPQSKNWGRGRRLRLRCLWAAVFACRGTTGLRYITAVTPEDRNKTRKSWQFLVHSDVHRCRSHCGLEGAGQKQNVFSGPKDT